jgi:hypothetical protein
MVAIIKGALELPLSCQIRIQDKSGKDITHGNWEDYHKMRDEGSVWFIITLAREENGTTS